MKTQLLLPLVLCAALLAVSLPARSISVAAQEIVENPQTDEFKGKVVVVYFPRGDSRRGAVLINAKLMELGGRTMLVGVGKDTGQERNWTAGVRIGIAWDEVNAYYAMTEEQYAEGGKKHREEIDKY